MPLPDPAAPTTDSTSSDTSLKDSGENRHSATITVALMYSARVTKPGRVSKPSTFRPRRSGKREGGVGVRCGFIHMGKGGVG